MQSYEKMLAHAAICPTYLTNYRRDDTRRFRMPLNIFLKIINRSPEWPKNGQERLRRKGKLGLDTPLEVAVMA
jgi:hypothetical protein